MAAAMATAKRRRGERKTAELISVGLMLLTSIITCIHMAPAVEGKHVEGSVKLHGMAPEKYLSKFSFNVDGVIKGHLFAHGPYRDTRELLLYLVKDTDVSAFLAETT